MNGELDPRLQKLFVHAREELAGDEFVARVMVDIDAMQRRARIGWLLIASLLLIIVGLLAAPLTSTVAVVSEVLPESLVHAQDGFVARMLAPANSISGVAGLSFLVLFAAARKLFR